MKYFLDGKPLSTFITQYLNIFISIPNFLSMTVDPPKISRNLFRGRIESIQSAGKKSPKVTFKTRPWLVHEIIVSEWFCISKHANLWKFFLLLFAATQLVRQLHQERTQVVCTIREARKRPAWRHSRNSCHMFVGIVVCACSRHALDFEMLFSRSFVIKGLNSPGRRASNSRWLQGWVRPNV